MTDIEGSITLIVPDQAQTSSGGSAIHLLPENASVVIGQAVSIDAGLIRANIDQCLAQVKQVFVNLQQPSVNGWQVENITVGLTITAQGSVGIATAGVEASLQITFTPTK